MSTLAFALPLLAAVAIYILRRPLLRLITPQGIPGIPCLPSPQPILGDLGAFGDVVKKTGRFSEMFEAMSREFGPVVQVRMSWLFT